MLRVYFLHHRELLGELSRAAAQTARELLAAAAGEEEGFRPGVVTVVQTFGDRANFYPHVHALVTRGGWTGSGEWVPVSYVDERAALRRRWANLIRRVYEVDPLVCPRCGAEMRVIGFITQPSVIKRILDHIRKRDRPARPPPPRVLQTAATPA